MILDFRLGWLIDNCRNMKASDIENRLIEFASRVIAMSEAMPKGFAAQHLATQIIRSATSPALNYGEAQGAESNADFVHKLKICLKELRETMVCLKIIESRGWFGPDKLSELLKENNKLIAIFVASAKIASAKSSNQPSKSKI